MISFQKFIACFFLIFGIFSFLFLPVFCPAQYLISATGKTAADRSTGFDFSLEIALLAIASELAGYLSPQLWIINLILSEIPSSLSPLIKTYWHLLTSLQVLTDGWRSQSLKSVWISGNTWGNYIGWKLLIFLTKLEQSLLILCWQLSVKIGWYIKKKVGIFCYFILTDEVIL